MLFSILTIDRQGCILASTLQAGSLEMGFEVLDEIATKGLLLVEVTLEDGASLIHLPVEAFNKQRCLPVIERLEKVWRQILSNPPANTSLPATSQNRVSLTSGRIQQHKECIHKLTLLIEQAEQRIQRVHTYSLETSIRRRTVAQLEASLTRLQENLVAEKRGLHRFLFVCEHP